MFKNKFTLMWILCLANTAIFVVVTLCEYLYAHSIDVPNAAANFAYPAALWLASIFTRIAKSHTDVPVEDMLCGTLIVCTVLTVASGFAAAFLADEDTLARAIAVDLVARGLGLVLADSALFLAARANNRNTRRTGGTLL